MITLVYFFGICAFVCVVAFISVVIAKFVKNRRNASTNTSVTTPAVTTNTAKKGWFEENWKSLVWVILGVVISNLLLYYLNYSFWRVLWEYNGRHLLFYLFMSTIVLSIFLSTYTAGKIRLIGVVLGIIVLTGWVHIQPDVSVTSRTQQQQSNKWSGETEVGKDWTQLRTPPDKANFTFYVVNPEGTDVSFSLHGGTGYYLLEDGTHTKTVTKRNGLSVERLRKSGWEGEVNGIVAKSNNGKIVVVKCVED